MSTDLRQQALLYGLPRVDAVLCTHPHADHIGGIDEMRSFNFLQGSHIPVYGNAWTRSELESRYPYIFNPGPIEGGGIPQLTLVEVSGNEDLFYAAGIPVVPIPVKHGSKDCLAFRFSAGRESVAYVTDCSYIPERSLQRLKGVSVLILDCLRIRPHGTHLNLDRALEVISQVDPGKTYLTHMGHDFDYTRQQSMKLPKGVFMAYDGLKIRFPLKRNQRGK